MTPKKKSPAKRGRKPKPEGRLDQLTVRLPEKLKFGLELLARAQGGRSLSQATEWAIQVGLRRQSAGSSNLSDVLDEAWEKTTEPERLYEVWKFEPSLLSFEDRAFCEMMASPALSAVMEPGKLVPKLDFSKEQRAELKKNLDGIMEQRAAMLADWKTLRNEAVTLLNKGHKLDEMGFDYLVSLLKKIRNA